ncbi:hypothetical protein [Paenibacillus sp. Mc5Re-14]|uniref:hypothetical protein n=1 Tax=Paenibacillus sp. Mc5Re-14 TaxID=1030529 RepID=UPI000AB0CABE|nr:hypothetical protein [Paenibacillus sp. Mc5Re-14]
MAEFTYGGNKLEYDFTTVLFGKGEFLDNDGEIQEINAIHLPTEPNGKHISVFDKEFEDKSVVEWRSYADGKILSFVCEKVEHWNTDWRKGRDHKD